MGLLLLLSLCGCAAKVGDGSPNLESVGISSYNNGTEDSQFVQVDLEFDREISLGTTDSLRITVSGNRVQEYSLEMTENAQTARLTFPVEAVTEGVLYIGKNGDTITDLCSADGTYAAADFEVQAIIPSGVTLSTVSSTGGQVTKSVDTAWSIRSIAWVGLYEDGELVPTTGEEQLDGFAAVHGHEFLIEDQADIAEKILETLTQSYGEDYIFSQNGTEITIQKPDSDAVLDLCIYQYTEINGTRLTQTQPETTLTETHTEESAQGEKYKTSEEDREIQPEEQAFLDLLRTARCGGEGVQEATALFQTLTITGDALAETEVYSVKDLEELIRLSFVNSTVYDLGLSAAAEGYYGLDFQVFLALSGVDTSDPDLTAVCGTSEGETTISLENMEDSTYLLALSNQDGPLDAEGPICLVRIQDGAVETIPNLTRLTLAYDAVPENPEYGYHDREPYLESEDLAFTVEVYQEGAEYLGALKTVSFTTAQLEDLMRQYPEAVVSGYYGTIGDADNYQYVGVGGWLDYFEGLDLYWLLTEQAGIEPSAGRAQLYDRDGELYSEIDDLDYLWQAHAVPEEYYVLTAEGLEITGMIPMVATVKNGAPILADHVHDDAGYIAYNTLNETLEALGVSTEVGVIKNHNGPFIACLGNRSGYYGGNEVETGNNCVTLRLYLQ
jgi:hypothetical protein